MITVLVPSGGLVVGATVALETEEEHHLAVRRAVPGTELQLLDGAGTRAFGRMVEAQRRVAVLVERVTLEPAPTQTVLAVGAGDRDRFGILVEQAGQLGATRIVPLETERTASVATRLRERHLERVRRRAREAIKQSRSVWAPEVDSPRSVTELLAGIKAECRWLADREGTSGPALTAAQPLVVAVGPEGGFTLVEREAFLAAGFQLVRLGPHLLRFETAALAALTTAWHLRERGRHG
jgi:16S rRNA (uracil1498-N3)-methyltransferase